MLFFSFYKFYTFIEGQEPNEGLYKQANTDQLQLINGEGKIILWSIPNKIAFTLLKMFSSAHLNTSSLTSNTAIFD